MCDEALIHAPIGPQELQCRETSIVPTGCLVEAPLAAWVGFVEGTGDRSANARDPILDGSRGLQDHSDLRHLLAGR
jgi:hypothetical protein